MTNTLCLNRNQSYSKVCTQLTYNFIIVLFYLNKCQFYVPFDWKKLTLTELCLCRLYILQKKYFCIENLGFKVLLIYEFVHYHLDSWAHIISVSSEYSVLQRSQNIFLTWCDPKMLTSLQTNQQKNLQLLVQTHFLALIELEPNGRPIRSWKLWR